MERHIIHYSLAELAPYVNWIYFHHAWQVSEPSAQQRLRSEAEAFLTQHCGHYRAHAVFCLCDACSDGDDIVLDGGVRLPTLRQQEPSADGLCWALADFIRPMSDGQPDRIGLFATTVDSAMADDFADDPYRRMMAQLLADRMAEAAAERMHQQVRTQYWAYAPDERLMPAQLHATQYRGIRPAVGYPSLPDASINFILSDILGFSSVGIRLTESGAMRPHASVSGLMIAHPSARYFTIGPIGEDQLRDYARRRGLPVEALRRFLECV